MNPSAPTTVDELEDLLSQPDDSLIELLGSLSGDVMFLGVGGKMGPTMARMAFRASRESGHSRRVFGVSRFGDEAVRRRLKDWGVETISCDLLDADAVGRLPECENIVYLVGFKFGASGNPGLTWAINCQVPAIVSQRFKDSRLVAMSTGNVYGLADAHSRGSTERDVLNPVGEYAMAALGRERIFEYYAASLPLPVAILRLNYATELRYGVLVDIALRVDRNEPIGLDMGYVNVIWLRDANLLSLRALAHCQSPAKVLNVAGGEIVSVRELATAFGERFNKQPSFEGSEQVVAFLNDGRHGHELLGRPSTSLETMIDWTAEWIRNDRPLLGKPTHFEVGDGKY